MSRVRIIGKGNPKRIFRKDITTVFLKAVTKPTFVVRLRKFSSPIHGLPHTPLLAL